jgi:dTDP-4-amino-4,6-dideoxygalactose transaminase
MAQVQAGRLAIHGGAPVRGADRTWPAWPVVTDAERRALLEVLDSGKWWYGEGVARFEEEFAAFQDAAHCVTCTSGTTSAEICVQALGIGPGDEVIVPAYTFIATASSVARMGATPVFVDVDESWCMDPAAAEAAITPRTQAIMPVHFGSRVADMDRINAIADAHGLAVIEDACHSWGAKWKGKGTGALGRCGVFSFQMSKNITAGEGGAIVTDDEALAERCRSIVNCGRVRNGGWYSHEVIGTNARLTEFAAALLRAQLARLEGQTLHRIEMAALLDRELAGIAGLTPQPGDPRMTRRAYHLYPFRLDETAFGCSRARFVEAARAEGMSLTAGYPLPLYAQPVFQRLGGRIRPLPCPVTEDLCAHSGLWFNHALLLASEEDMRDIARIFAKLKEHVADLADAGGAQA